MIVEQGPHARIARDDIRGREGREEVAIDDVDEIIDLLWRDGDVLGVARIAAIQAAKRTSELVPLCHPLPIAAVTVDLTPDTAGSAVDIEATVRTTGQTGVEMEALTAASVTALTVYDMCKSVDRGMRIEAIRVVHKAGGKSGDFRQP